MGSSSLPSSTAHVTMLSFLKQNEKHLTHRMVVNIKFKNVNDKGYLDY